MKNTPPAPFPQIIQEAKKGDLLLILHDRNPIAVLGKFEKRSRYRGTPIIWIEPAYKLEPPQQVQRTMTVPTCKPWYYGLHAAEYHSCYRGKKKVLEALHEIPWLHPYRAFIESWKDQKASEKRKTG